MPAVWSSRVPISPPGPNWQPRRRIRRNWKRACAKPFPMRSTYSTISS
jgi:hypothetical protein